MSTTEASALDNFIVRMHKIWWGFEVMLEKWRLAMGSENEDWDPRIPPDVPLNKLFRGPVQVIVDKGGQGQPGHSFLGKVIVGVAIGVITMAVGFIGGATWSHNTRITALETYRVGDKENQDKLERRVDNLETRIPR